MRDDYAHHPTEIEAFLKSLRKSMYAGKKVTVLFSRTPSARSHGLQKAFQRV
ncbi:MAG: cyanophycin synthetase [Cyclobacteriaceae bacterium]